MTTTSLYTFSACLFEVGWFRILCACCLGWLISLEGTERGAFMNEYSAFKQTHALSLRGLDIEMVGVHVQCSRVNMSLFKFCTKVVMPN